jgi:hypothetical protein
MSGGIGESGPDCNPTTCIVKVFDIIASLYVNAYQYEYSGIHNGRPIDGGGQINDTVIGACYTDNVSLEQAVADICYIFRIERQFKADGLYLYRNASLDEPAAIAATIESHELATTDTSSDGIRYDVATTFMDSSNAVTKIAFNFLDADNDFKPNQLTAKSPDAIQTDPERQVSLPFVMTVADAETVINRLITDSRLSLIQHTFRLPPKYAWLAKGDVIVLKHGIFTDTVRILSTDFNKDKSQSVTAVTVASSTNAVPTKSYTSQRTQLGGDIVDSEPLFFDIPTPVAGEVVGPAALDQFGMYYAVVPKVAGYWLGAYFARQLTKDSDAYATLFHVVGKNSAGDYIARWRAINALTDKRWVTDSDTLALSAGNGGYLASRNTDKAGIDANGLTNLAVYGAPGRWEIIQFEKVINNVMSGIVRGLRGTEWACGMHQPGDYIYTLGPSLVLSLLNKSYLGSTAKYRGVSDQKQFILAEQVQAPAFVGNSRRPFAPYHFRGTRGQDGAITFTWLRRDRGGSGWGKALPLTEGSLYYEVDVCTPGGVVLRTTTVDTEQFVYTSAMQTADGTGGATEILLQVRQRGDINLGFNGSEIVDV